MGGQFQAGKICQLTLTTRYTRKIRTSNQFGVASVLASKFGVFTLLLYEDRVNSTGISHAARVKPVWVPEYAINGTGI